MNRNIVLGFASGLVFAASLVIGLMVADAATDQGDGEPRLPGALGDPIELVAGVPISDPDAPIDLEQPIEPTQAAYVPVDSGGGGGISGGGGTPPGGGAGTDGTAPGDTTELTVAPLAPDPFAPVELDPGFTGSFTGDLFFEFLEFPPFRFLDLCADDGALPGCPLGVGGTVLAPLGDPPDADFRLGSDIRNVFDVRANCGDEYPTEEDEHALFVWANHPAVFEITYHWTARPDLTDTVTVSNADPDHPEFVRYADDFAEDRLATSAWPRECFILTEIPVTLASGDSTLRGPYTVEVNATSFAGATASRTYAFRTGSGVRPPTYYWDRDDYNLDVLVPVKRGIQGSGITVIHESTATNCADVEADGFHLGEVIPADESGFTFYGLNQPIGPDPGGARYSSAYDSRDVIHVRDLEGGTTYLVCVWWFESAERSFDSASVVEREMTWITTPNGLTASVVASSVQNTSSLTLLADSYTVSFSCGSGALPIEIPPTDMAPESELTIPGSPVLCDYEGRQIRNPTIGTAVHRDGTRQDFAIALDPSSSTRGYQRFAVDLSDGDGPILTLNAFFTEGSDGGTDRWQLGTPLVFEPLPDEPEELPAEIVIDQLASRVGPDGRDAIRVTAEFDRPVRLNASLLGGLDLGATSLSDPCLTGPAPSHASAGLSRTHSFRLDGLCLRSRYSVLLEVEAADGTTASFADMTIPPFVPDGRYFSGIGWTDGYHVEYTVRATIPGIGETIHVVTFGAAIDGVDFDFRGTRRCAAENRPPEGQVRRATDVWGDEVTVTVVFFADDADNAISSECVPYESLYGRDRWSASVTTTFTIEDFMAGEVSIPFRAAPVGSGRSLDENAIVISGVVTG